MKFSPGQVVQLKSGGALFTIVTAYPELAEGEERRVDRGSLKGPAPATYDLVTASQDGTNIATCCLPEHTLTAVEA
jgi:hypothetical protein